jgi:predicted permease
MSGVFSEKLWRYAARALDPVLLTSHRPESLEGVANTYIQRITVNILNPIILLLFAAALLVFLWGVMIYVKDSHSSEGRRTGGKHILWGVIGMAIMVSAFGILNLIVNTLEPYQPPQYTPPISVPQ